MLIRIMGISFMESDAKVTRKGIGPVLCCGTATLDVDLQKCSDFKPGEIAS